MLVFLFVLWEYWNIASSKEEPISGKKEKFRAEKNPCKNGFPLSGSYKNCYFEQLGEITMKRISQLERAFSFSVTNVIILD